MKRRGFLGVALAGATLLGLGSGLSLAVAKQNQKEAPTRRVHNWQAVEGITYENLSVFPVVIAQGADTAGYLTLDEGLLSGEVVVTERGGEILRRSRGAVPQAGRTQPIFPEPAPQVNQLVLVNRSKKPLVLLAGEVVTGGKQDRVIAKDRIVPPGAEPLPLDVFCVERGRWAGATMQFSASKLMVHPSVREKAALERRQDEVWAAVRSGTTAPAPAGAAVAAPLARSLDAAVAEAPTESYARIYAHSRVGQSVESFAEEVMRRFARAAEALKGRAVVGVVVAYGGEVAWADVFASPHLFECYWPKLARSYAVEALARPQLRERATLDDAREFLRPLAGRETLESEPGVYRWRQIAEGRLAEIELESLSARPLVLHWVKIRRTS
jgi:hypothetical protein